MRFRCWAEQEASLGAVGALPVNRGSSAVASGEVLRTGLQPQVDAEEIETAERAESDAIGAIDAALERFESDLPSESSEAGPKVKRFLKRWKSLQEEWEQLKISRDVEPEADGVGLGAATGSKSFRDAMQRFPNMMPVGPQQTPQGPGTFGQS